jgi:hypothetical protein
VKALFPVGSAAAAAAAFHKLLAAAFLAFEEAVANATRK